MGECEAQGGDWEKWRTANGTEFGCVPSHVPLRSSLYSSLPPTVTGPPPLTRCSLPRSLVSLIRSCSWAGGVPLCEKGRQHPPETKAPESPRQDER